MTQQSNNVVNQDDEIDLVALMFSLWKRKWTIIWTTIIFAIGSIGYALFAPQVWTSTAVITAPKIKDIVNYLGQVQQYTSIGNQYTKMPGYLLDNNWLFGQFKEVLISKKVQADFFKDTNAYKSLINAGYSSHQALNTLYKNIKINKLDNKDSVIPLDAISISINATNPQIAQKLLFKLVQNADVSAKEMILGNQRARVHDLGAGLKLELERIQENTVAERKHTIQQLNDALQTAKNAEIKTYQPVEEANGKLTLNSLPTGNLIFMLGEKNLAAQINTLENSPLVYSSRYYQIKAQLTALDALITNEKAIQFSTYSYQDAPSYPVSRTKPKRAIIVIAGTVAGGVVGVLIALFMNAVATYRRKENMPE